MARIEFDEFFAFIPVTNYVISTLSELKVNIWLIWLFVWQYIYASNL